MNSKHSTHSNPIVRHPSKVMHPHRLGAMHQTRLSFARSLVRKMAKEYWQVTVHRWHINEQGFGTAIYQLNTPNHSYHLVIFSDEIDDNARNDRVIAEQWDVTFALVKGDVSEQDLQHLRDNVPLQEGGRNTSRVLVLSRANKSVRLFDHVVQALSQGLQPDLNELAKTGYILRTTAVYGNGKFGLSDFHHLQNNPDFNVSFRAQMCAVYLLRHFSIDWVNFLAKCQGGTHAVTLDHPLQEYLGIGNATGLGMAPYLIKHPCVVDQWITQREKALTIVSVLPVTQHDARSLAQWLNRACRHLSQISTIDEHQGTLNTQAIDELPQIIECLEGAVQQGLCWGEVIEQQHSFSLETQEILTSCVLELFPEQVDQLAEAMNAPEVLSLEVGLTIERLRNALETTYDWAIAIDFDQPDSHYWFWYCSEDKEEPRLGIRYQDNGEDREQPLDIARQANRLYQALKDQPSEQSVAAFLLAHPQHRTIARRVWTISQRPMGEIQANVLAKDMRPMDLLRCKLSMFGATKFDPRSDRWVRVTLFQGAPLCDSLHDGSWCFPLLPTYPPIQNSTVNKEY